MASDSQTTRRTGFKTWLVFILTGLVYALLVEFEHKILAFPHLAELKDKELPQTGKLLFIATVFYFFALNFFYFLHKRVNRWFISPRRANIAYLLITGAFGLIGLEWMLVGNTPAGNPNASQILMFIFHAAYPFMARIAADGRDFSRRISRRARLYTSAAVLLSLGGLALPSGFAQFAWFIYALMVAYTGLYVFIWQYNLWLRVFNN